MAAPVLATTPFEQLRLLRQGLQVVFRSSVPALEAYFDETSGGFYHLIEPDDERIPGDFSKASTATVVNFLVRSGQWSEGSWDGYETSLAAQIFKEPWASAGLDAGNPFTTSFMLELLASLDECGATFSRDQTARISEELRRLGTFLREGGGGIAIKSHPPTAYLTQLAARVLLKWRRLPDKAASQVQQWAARNLDRELAILHASPAQADLYEIAYSVLLLQRLGPKGDRAQRDVVIERDIISYAVDAFFEHQLEDGSWPRSRPLFHYPKVGNAYCYEYELLVQVLGERTLWPLLLPHMDGLSRAVDNLERRKYPITDDVFAWSSGHHRHLRSPESWSTASVLHYCYELDRLSADAVRRVVFYKLGQPYVPPARTGPTPPILPASFLDSSFVTLGRRWSLRRVIERRFLKPLVEERNGISAGRSFSTETPVSAILYGPPGTSKTQLAGFIAESLKWPLLKVDPSYLVRHGLENVQAETTQLFDLLFETEEVVVLFDEIDELVRERGAAFEASSRFLTTAMLPKLAGLSDRRRIVYLVATNHLELFDAAISRPGRFDMIVPINPPTLEAKLAKWEALAAQLERFKLGDDKKTRAALAALTYGEMKSALSDLLKAATVDEFTRRVEAASLSAILNQELPGQEPVTWEAAIASEQHKIRVPSGS